MLDVHCNKEFFCRQCCFCGTKQLEFHVNVPQGCGDPVGEVVRNGKKGICHSFVDNYFVNFPENASKEDKFRLICVGIICDYLFLKKIQIFNLIYKYK